MEVKTALITGITGQDGSYLAELLLDKGYTVHGINRRASSFNTARIDHLYEDPHVPSPRLRLHYGDLTDGSQIARLIRTIEPDEIYNLGAQSHVAVSFQQPEYTGDVDGLGTVRLLEAIRESGIDTRLYQAGTSRNVRGRVAPPQSETSPFRPRSPYAAAKLYAYWLVRNYREAYGMFAIDRDPLQPRIALSRRDVRDPKDHAGSGPYCRRPAEHPVPRQSRRPTRLGPRRRLRPSDVADAPGRNSHRLRDRDRGSRSIRDFLNAAFGVVGLDWEPYVEIDPTVLPTNRCRILGGGLIGRSH